MENLVILPREEAAMRLAKVQEKLAGVADAMLVTDYANLYYLTGRVFAGWAYIPVDGNPLWIVRRPIELGGDGVAYVRKPEEISGVLESNGLSVPVTVGLELDLTPWNTVDRLCKALGNPATADVTNVMREARSVKTPGEIEMLKLSGARHSEVYARIPSLYHIGMTDFELDVEIEYLSRKEGNLGIFRISGQSMEFFMSSVLTGENADAPTPYDFALGGAGMNPSLPVGASGEEIKRNRPVMVDANGNYTGYMTDMTRVFSLGPVPDEARRAHECSIEIHRMFAREAVPGTEAKALYERALEIVKSHGLERYFMGHRQHAGFVGHGVGIEINEWPVIAPKSRQVLREGNVIALEPKFVLPGIGAVGVENTYVVCADHAECITTAPEDIVEFIV